jgi:hypothetical protein
MVIPFVSALVSLVALIGQAPALDSTERARARQMLNEIKSAIRSTYYDQATGHRSEHRQLPRDRHLRP